MSSVTVLCPALVRTSTLRGISSTITVTTLPATALTTPATSHYTISCCQRRTITQRKAFGGSHTGSNTSTYTDKVSRPTIQMTMHTMVEPPGNFTSLTTTLSAGHR